MQFYSTNNSDNRVGLEEAVRRGLPADKGLFMPEEIPQLPDSFFERLSSLSIAEIGYEVLRPYVKDVVADNVLAEICNDAFSFALSMPAIKENVYALELYHGPTLAFKDFGARFMARLLGHFNASNNGKNTILVATSGDTGSAVANGFYGVKNVEVIILYPQGKVSDLQEKQMTTLGKNIQALAIDGTFDDCQRLVKTAFLDQALSEKYGLTSANSINLARLLPQMIYYFYAYGQVASKNKPVVFSVPSGNYGNLSAGMIAKKMGLPIDHFIAAANANDIVPQYLTTGNYQPRPSIETISNAMDVGDPSNFVRLQDIFKHNLSDFQAEVRGYSYSDAQTRETMHAVNEELNYVLDPHGAIAYRALQEYLKDDEATGIFLETAHPIKFRGEVEPIIGHTLEVPEALKAVLEAKKIAHPCGADYDGFKAMLNKVLDA